jgi:hypothetical protein
MEEELKEKDNKRIEMDDISGGEEENLRSQKEGECGEMGKRTKMKKVEEKIKEKGYD